MIFTWWTYFFAIAEARKLEYQAFRFAHRSRENMEYWWERVYFTDRLKARQRDERWWRRVVALN